MLASGRCHIRPILSSGRDKSAPAMRPFLKILRLLDIIIIIIIIIFFLPSVSSIPEGFKKLDRLQKNC